MNVATDVAVVTVNGAPVAALLRSFKMCKNYGGLIKYVPGVGQSIGRHLHSVPRADGLIPLQFQKEQVI